MAKSSSLSHLTQLFCSPALWQRRDRFVKVSWLCGCTAARDRRSVCEPVPPRMALGLPRLAGVVARARMAAGFGDTNGCRRFRFRSAHLGGGLGGSGELGARFHPRHVLEQPLAGDAQEVESEGGILQIELAHL